MREIAARLIASGVAAVLAYSAYSHLENGHHFLHTILNYRLVGHSLGLVLAIAVPFVQLLLALIVLFDPPARTLGFFVCSLLFASFAIVQSTAWARGLNIACGCFGASDDNPIGPASIGLAAACAIVSFAGWWLARGRRVVPS
jgi:hypothetical protein